CFLSIALLQPAFAEPPALPEIPGWQNGACKIVGLDTVSGNHGFWIERSYRTADGGAFKATWMGGKGPKFLYPPTLGLMSDDGPIGAGATYETCSIAGNLAILETHPTLGHSLSLLLPDGVLTLESDVYGMEKEQIMKAAETLAMQIKLR
ncbi:hypothetical protein LJC31_06755, partial [Synergistaceae bacterium OttesenSCG-928-I11]|nr:hypothetical protein [Synergistaceae bacterium OttesenSCG-928-I11]